MRRSLFSQLACILYTTCHSFSLCNFCLARWHGCGWRSSKAGKPITYPVSVCQPSFSPTLGCPRTMGTWSVYCKHRRRDENVHKSFIRHYVDKKKIHFIIRTHVSFCSFLYGDIIFTLLFILFCLFFIVEDFCLSLFFPFLSI